MLRAPLKWVGGKTRIIDRLREHFPAGNRLVEPFAGSGAVMLNTDFPRYLMGDINPDLMNFHIDVRDNTEELLDHAKWFFSTGNHENVYYRYRAEFNQLTAATVYRSALFLFLNRHCFNGLCRYNAKGEFNVPFGRYPSPYLPEKEILVFADKAHSARFVTQSWLDTLKQVKHGDVVYLDPPYIPTSATANFTAYAKEPFNLTHQKELAEALFDLGSYGIPIIASNSNTPLAVDLYSKFKVENIYAPRSVGGAAVAKEIIAKLNC